MEEDILFSKAAALSVDKRRKLAHMLLESISTGEMSHDDRYALLVSKAEVATCHNLGNTQTTENTTIRRFVATRLYKEGYSWVEIARLMGRNHSTVIGLVRSMEGILQLKNSYKVLCKQYETFNDLVDEFDNS